MEYKCIEHGEPNFDMEEFKKATQPVIEFMQKHYCPHDSVIIDICHAELLCGEMAYSVEVPD